MITFVTAFLDLREDRSNDKSVQRCFILFKELMATGVRLHLFLSRSYENLYRDVCGSPPNVHVEFIELEDLTTYKELLDINVQLPSQRTDYHDTKNFLILMNSKIEFIHRAMRQVTTTHYAWIDFSIFHVFQDPAATSRYITMLGNSRPAENQLFMPGCWPQGGTSFSSIHWRFCGGFFLGDKHTLEAFYTIYRRIFRAVVAAYGLTWEVNMWAYFETIGQFRPTWIQANHNDSIVRVPATSFKVVASLTTIPPRLETSCRAAIDSLLSQVDHVYLSVAHEYKRFGAWTPPDYFFLEPYSSRLTVLYTTDNGPATKYLGGLQVIPKDNWVFVCDDDQEYHPGLLGRMMQRINELAVYQNHYENIKVNTSGGLIHGYVGLLVHASLLSALPQFPLPACAYFVDDQWMSIYCFLQGIPIRSTGIEEYYHIYRVLDEWHEKIGVCSLAELHNRAENVRAIEKEFGVTFNGWKVEALSVEPPHECAQPDHKCLED